jgi:hypothetical protein
MKKKKEKLKHFKLEPIEFEIQTDDEDKPLKAVRASLTAMLKMEVERGMKEGSIQQGKKLQVRINGDGRDLGKRGKNNSVIVTFTLLDLGHPHLDSNIHTILLMQGSENYPALRKGKHS